MEKRYLVTKKKVLKNVEPETFETNQTWIEQNKKIMKIHGMTYEEIPEKKELDLAVEEEIPVKKPKNKKDAETQKADENQIIENSNQEKKENEI